MNMNPRAWRSSFFNGFCLAAVAGFFGNDLHADDAIRKNNPLYIPKVNFAGLDASTRPEERKSPNEDQKTGE